MPLTYSIGLLLVFYVLLIAEFCLPTGGLLGVAAVVTAVAVIAIAFTHSVAAGVTMMLVLAATTPFVFMGAVRLWPHTPIGRRILNRRLGDMEPAPAKTLADGTPLSDLEGQMGRALTDLLPAGQVLIGEKKINAVSTGMVIDQGSAIVVVRVIAGKIQVRPASEEESHARHDQGRTPQSPASLESALESFDVDSFE